MVVIQTIARSGRIVYFAESASIGWLFQDWPSSEEWTPERMDFFFDEKKYHSFDVKTADDPGQNPFRQPQYLLINLALGGSWGGKIDDSVLPQKYLLDYVRVYQKDTAQQ
ncbi:MAG: family 16 glycosylhydrolase [Planctomycetota bacterium]|nr:family 16 glycosylhydrolase [Planctomycetota bacterium]